MLCFNLIAEAYSRCTQTFVCHKADPIKSSAGIRERCLQLPSLISRALPVSKYRLSIIQYQSELVSRSVLTPGLCQCLTIATICVTKELSTALLKRTCGTGGRQAGCDLPYEDRLNQLGLFNLEIRRLWETFQCLRGGQQERRNRLLSEFCCGRTRGNVLKL